MVAQIPENSLLKLIDVTGGFREGSLILKGITFEMKTDETVAVVGQNGAGKSTLAKAIMGVLPFQEGTCSFEGRDLDSCDKRALRDAGIGYFMQGGRVFPHLSVADNLSMAGWDLTDGERRNRTTEITSYFELLSNAGDGIWGREASYLSGGEKNQLALALVLMPRPRFLILDEPSAGLSPGNTDRLYNALNMIREQESCGILLIEQHVRVAVEFSERVVLLKEGRIDRQEKCPELMDAGKLDEFFFGSD